MSLSQTEEVICYGLVRTRTSQQEWYETASKHTRRRLKKLRGLGFHVSSERMGPQVTNLGKVAMTLVTIYNLGYDAEVLPPDQVIRL